MGKYKAMAATIQSAYFFLHKGLLIVNLSWRLEKGTKGIFHQCKL